MKPRPPRRGPGDTLLSPDFQEKVARLDKLMSLAAAPTPKAPPGFTLVKEGGDEGTLQQVGREADSAWAGVKRIMALLNVETKSVDMAAGVTPTNAGTAVILLSNGISQGVTDSQRTGDSVKLTHLKLKFHVYYVADNLPMTIALVRSKDGLPAVADVFETIGSTVYSGMSDENHDQRVADSWIWSKYLILDQYHPSKIWEVDIPLDMHTLYSAASTTPTSGSLSLWAITNQPAGSNVVRCQATLSFVDN